MADGRRNRFAPDHRHAAEPPPYTNRSRTTCAIAGSSKTISAKPLEHGLGPNRSAAAATGASGYIGDSASRPTTPQVRGGNSMREMAVGERIGSHTTSRIGRRAVRRRRREGHGAPKGPTPATAPTSCDDEAVGMRGHPVRSSRWPTPAVTLEQIKGARGTWSEMGAGEEPRLSPGLSLN